MALTKATPQASFAFHQVLPPFSLEVFNILVAERFTGPEERLVLFRRVAAKAGRPVSAVIWASKVLLAHGFMRERLNCDAERMVEFKADGWRS